MASPTDGGAMGQLPGVYASRRRPDSAWPAACQPSNQRRSDDRASGGLKLRRIEFVTRPRAQVPYDLGAKPMVLRTLRRFQARGGQSIVKREPAASVQRMNADETAQKHDAGRYEQRSRA